MAEQLEIEAIEAIWAQAEIDVPALIAEVRRLRKIEAAAKEAAASQTDVSHWNSIHRLRDALAGKEPANG